MAKRRTLWMPTLKPLGTLLNAPDYADRVNLIKKIKTANGWRFAPVVPEANGRLKDRVRINGKLEVHPEGAYYIEWRVGGPPGRRRPTARARVGERVRAPPNDIPAGATTAGRLC